MLSSNTDSLDLKFDVLIEVNSDEKLLDYKRALEKDSSLTKLYNIKFSKVRGEQISYVTVHDHMLGAFYGAVSFDLLKKMYFRMMESYKDLMHLDENTILQMP
jgi:hypothetical protein